MMLHTNDIIEEIVKLLKTASERELRVVLEFVRSLIRK